jgi:hypothetical protein
VRPLWTFRKVIEVPSHLFCDNDISGDMALHLIKLCVGCDSIDELADWQRQKLARLRKADSKAKLMHVTRQTPRREGFTPGSSSIYWVMGGFIRVRQVIVGLEPTRDADGISRCGLVLEPQLVATEAHPRRAFQGWRYLPAEDAPPDLVSAAAQGRHAPPASMHAALMELRLL